MPTLGFDFNGVIEQARQAASTYRRSPTPSQEDSVEDVISAMRRGLQVRDRKVGIRACHGTAHDRSLT